MDSVEREGFTMKILLLEDDRILSEMLSFNLKNRGNKVEISPTLADAYKMTGERAFDLFILDVDIPDGNGFDFYKELDRKTPAIFLTAIDFEEDILRGYELGALDYITKPFHVSVFMKKIEIIERNMQAGSISKMYDDGFLYIDFEKNEMLVDEVSVSLTANECRMLEYFIDNCNIILTRSMLLKHFWDDDENYVDENALTMLISRIRSKIETGGKKYIKTIYGMGYQWIGDEYEK